jgi:tetratricopeptide (TPR) repeat protein
MVASFSLLPPPAPNEKAYKHTTRGNDYFERHLYNDAILEYTKVLQMSKGGEEDREFIALIYSNRSASYIKINEFAKAYKDAIKVIELAPLWSKVNFLLLICLFVCAWWRICFNKRS